MNTDFLPKDGVIFFNKIKEDAISRGNSIADSELIALEVVKTKLVEKEGKLVAMSNAFKPTTIYTFQMSNPETKVIMNSENEEIVMEAILADTDKNTDGMFFSETELADINEQINLLGSTLPDVDHEKLKMLVAKYGRDDAKIKEEIAKEKGVFKTIKSMIKDGKLWIQTVLDKRYKNHLDKFNSLSIEAFADADTTKRLRNPKYLGFTFTNNPKLKSARIIK